MQIKIESGQGITQAIKATIEKSGQKVANNNLSIWQQVMTEVKNAQSQNSKASFYTGGDDVNNIGKKSSYKTDFKVEAESQISLSDSIWNRIVELLTGKKSGTDKKEVKSGNAQEVKEQQMSITSVETEPKIRVVTPNQEKSSEIQLQPSVKPVTTGDNRSEVYMNAVGYHPEKMIVSDNVYSLDNDTQYQKFNSQFKNIDAKMKEIEKKYNVIRESDNMTCEQNMDAFSSILNITDRNDLNEYNRLSISYKMYDKDLKSYREIMSNWGDKKLNYYTNNINGNTEIFTNLEQIMLADGRRAWKTDQGIFLPGFNGYPNMAERIEVK